MSKSPKKTHFHATNANKKKVRKYTSDSGINRGKTAHDFS
jgi:hypothetical protein